MFIKGFIIGLVFGIPAGAVGALTLERTLKYGFLTGFLSGLGCSAADLIYACIGAFGITVVSDFILDNQLIINTSGSIILLVMGISMMTKSSGGINIQLQKTGILKMSFSSFIIGITNPASILTFIWAFSWLEISRGVDFEKGCYLGAGVFSGTALWWLVLSSAASLFKSRISNNIMGKIDKVFGFVIILLSIVVFIKIFIE